jgi:hypothetical protein
MQENDSCGKDIYVDDVQRPEKVSDTCVEAIHGETTDGGFTVDTDVLEKHTVLPPSAVEL